MKHRQLIRATVRSLVFATLPFTYAAQGQTAADTVPGTPAQPQAQLPPVGTSQPQQTAEQQSTNAIPGDATVNPKRANPAKTDQAADQRRDIKRDKADI